MDIITAILTDGIFAAMAGIGFGAISNTRQKTFLYIGILAAIGHSLRFCLLNYAKIDIATASFFGGIIIGFLSLPLGKMAKAPCTALYIPALLPMIPGKFAYSTIFSMIKFLQSMNNEAEKLIYMEKFFSNFLITMSVIFLLAVGAIIPTFIFPNKAYSITRDTHKKKAKQI